ncbi:MAG: hypothetical protein NPIRA02_01120 [Nitrospirales bacterium]|nr:MAG: hypothetical protein NPIRA02_01120 [Nitrospirales bacterium]
MTKQLIILVALGGMSFYGCANQTLTNPQTSFSGPKPIVRSQHQSHNPSSSQPESGEELTTSPSNDVKEEEPTTLKQLEQLAQEHNPTLRQARMQIKGERAKALQAGLYPNPIVGYSGEQIGVNDTVGEFQGGFVQQRIVTAGKLRLSREKYLARASGSPIDWLMR